MTRMIVADIGNTDTVFGIFKDNELIYNFRLRSHAAEGSVFYGYQLRNFFLEKNIDPSGFQASVVSSVVPAMTPVIQEVLSDISPSVITVLPGIFPAVPVEIQNQNELGSDIYSNMVAAKQLFKEACIVVDFGTALSVTGMNSKGIIKGVAIAPGIGTAIKSLFSQTAQLPEVPLELPPNAMGTNTISSIQAGVLYGYEGMVKNLVKKFTKELDEPVKVIATGGLSSIIHTLHDQFDLVDLNLTLNGLRIIGEYFQLKNKNLSS